MLIHRPVGQIPVPPPQPDQNYEFPAGGRRFSFKGLKKLLGAADHDKAGDRGAGLAARGEPEREAARSLLSGLTLQHLYDRPLTDSRGKVDAVMRANYEIDHDAFSRLASKSVGELKDLLLESTGEEIKGIGRGLTGVMAAAVCKLLDAHELIAIARLIACPTQARTRLGMPGTLSSRLQPNHPTDDPRCLRLLINAGLSIGAGDALIGVNPAIDTVENVSTILRHLDSLRSRTGVPTQICVLAHVKTQLACLKRGAPVEILFQSLAGTESTLLTEFDVSIELLDEAYRIMASSGPLREVARQFMYFETGQGSEFTYGKHDGIDMATTEALCYGLARRYDPFMVNNVTGFIGPETHLDNFEMIISNLQDHFMGKLLGLPMGMAPCYTLHSRITLDGQQIATELLAAAGANYFMDVCLNTDRMLAYFDTSGHDDQTLREIHGKRTTPEYERWAISQGIFQKDSDGLIVRGPAWGDLRRFCDTDAEYAELLEAAPSFPGFRHAGSRTTNALSRQVRMNQAVARDAIYRELRPEEIQRELQGKLQIKLKATAPFRVVETEAPDHETHLSRPDAGARLSASSRLRLKPERKQVQCVVTDGLSADAVHANLPELMPVLRDGFKAHGLSMGKPILAKHGRVKLGEEIAARLKAEVTVLLIGERPGGDALSSLSLSAYLVFQLLKPADRKKAARFSHHPAILFETSVISNIYSPGGLPPFEAGSVIVEKVLEILAHRAAGNRLETLLNQRMENP